MSHPHRAGTYIAIALNALLIFCCAAVIWLVAAVNELAGSSVPAVIGGLFFASTALPILIGLTVSIVLLGLHAVANMVYTIFRRPVLSTSTRRARLAANLVGLATLTLTWLKVA